MRHKPCHKACNMTFMALLLLTPALFLSGLNPAFSAEAEDALQALNQGIQYYNQLELESAISSLETSLKGEMSKFDKVKAYQYLALCYDALNDSKKMNEAFSQILDIDLNYQAPSDLPPRLTDIITKFKIQKTIIEVASTPAGAKVIVDGKETSKSTPAKFTAEELGEGTHTISVSFVGYTAEEPKTISVYRAKPSNVEFKLTQIAKAPVDMEKPKVNLLQTLPESVNIDKDLVIKANATDNVKVVSVKIFYKLPQTDFVSANMEASGPDEYQFAIRKELLKKGKVELYFEAVDGAGNSAQMPHKFVNLKEAGGGKTWLWVALGTVAAGGAGAAALALSKGEPLPSPSPSPVQTGSISFVIDF